MSENRKPEQGVKLRGAEKVARIPVKLFLRLKHHANRTGFASKWQHLMKYNALKLHFVSKITYRM